MFFTLQLIKSIIIYCIFIDPQIMIYLDELRKLVEFKSIDPKFLIKKYFDVDISKYISDKTVQMTKSSELSGMKSGSILENATIYLVLFALIILFFALSWVILKTFRKNKKIKKLVREK